MDYAQNTRRWLEYVEALEEERRKIQVFERELPLCLELVTQAIEACMKEISGGSTTTDYMQGQTDCSDHTSSDVPVLEEFLPIKRSFNCSEEGDELESHKSKDHDINTKEKNVVAAAADKKKSDWLRSVRLWNNNQSPDPSLKDDAGKSGSVVKVKRNEGSFHQLQREKIVEKSVQSVGKGNASATSTSTTESGSRVEGANDGNTNSRREERDGQPQKKQRRCWSPELHRRFLHALQQLGGSHVATPKQIRELMKVDGLTNDEVKSHLQKYRLHTRRPSQTVHNNVNPQVPQFVVVGGIWVPPPEYATMTATTASGKTASVTPTSRIYNPVVAPLPTLPQPSGTTVRGSQRPQSEERGSRSGGRVHSNSPSTSTSTHTTTDSPVF
ncbi:transcription factor HHO3-like [Durio zibethinus]|uniref:Transcription factor HHO3-like n=1 Tax=Durio zibethinus TaxID=66656 RepID=A0A6P5Y1S0_DURZI|nr:transcription factor HHO3-like [Durio zibethinus]